MVRRAVLVGLSAVLATAGGAGATVLDRDVDLACADVVDGWGSTSRRTTLAVPDGPGVDLGARVVVDVLLAAPSCRGVTYSLEVLGWSPVPGGGPTVPLATAERAGTGGSRITFSVDVRDLAALRDPVDVEGRARCAYVVVRTAKGERPLDRAPDTGTHELCPDGSGVQPPLS